MKPMTTAEMIAWLDAQAEDHRKKSAWETIPAYKQEHADKADRYAAIARRLRLLEAVAERADTFIRADGRNDPPARYAELKKSVQALDADEREGGSDGTK